MVQTFVSQPGFETGDAEVEKSREVSLLGDCLLDFNDLLGNDCTLHSLRMHDQAALEVYSVKPGSDEENTLTTAYWTQAQVRAMLPALTMFAETGSLGRKEQTTHRQG